jgi:transcriptional regulator with XRE-family HTH domain
MTEKHLQKYNEALGTAIKQRRINLGLTLEDAESKGYTSWRHLQKVESGKNITIQTLVKVSYVLDCTPSDLLKDAEKNLTKK